jgi:hypothetical protein
MRAQVVPRRTTARATGTWNVIRSSHEAGGAVTVSACASRATSAIRAHLCGLDHVMMKLDCRDDDTVIIMDSEGSIAGLDPDHARSPERRIPSCADDPRGHGGLGGFAKRVTSPIFYRTFSALSGSSFSPETSDFRAFSGTFLSQYLRFAETNRFNRGLFVWMGFRTQLIPTGPRPARRHRAPTPSCGCSVSRGGITYFASRR